MKYLRKSSKNAAKAGINVITVGFGTENGAEIPVREGGKVVAKRDEDGQIVITKYDPRFLREVAEAGHGEFIAAMDGDRVVLDRLADDVVPVVACLGRPAARRLLQVAGAEDRRAGVGQLIDLAQLVVPFGGDVRRGQIAALQLIELITQIGDVVLQIAEL